MSIRLLTLGGLFGHHDDAELGWLRSQWLRAALLTYLTLERKATRETLQAMFWPESDAETAAHRLSQTVYAVRRVLGDDCIETHGRELHAGAHLEADALDFERAIQAGRLDDAIALYRGPFLAGVHLASTKDFESWVDATRARCARQFRKACRTDVDASVGAGDMAGAIAVARTWVAPDPIDDEAQHRLIELLAQAGERSEARKQYEEYAKLLETDGLQPLDKTRELMATLDRDTPATAATQSQVLTPPRVLQPEPLVVTVPYSPPVRKRWTWQPWAVGALMAGLGALVAAVIITRDDPLSDTLSPELAIAILPVKAASAGGELDWLAGGLQGQLSSVLTEVSGLDVRPTENVVTRRAAGLTLDSIALILPVDYFIEVTLSKGERDSVLVTIVLIEGGLQNVKAGTVRALLRANMVEDLGQRVADLLRPMLGARMQARQLERGPAHPLALRRRREAEHFKLQAIEFMNRSDLVGAARAFDAARDRLIESQNFDPNWPAPRLARAALSYNQWLLITTKSRGRDQAGARNALNEGIAIVDSVLRKREWSQHPPALAMRGRLRWTRIQVADGEPHARMAIDSAANDLRLALDHDNTLAGAAVDLSQLLFKEDADYSGAALWAQHAYDADIYMDERERSAIINGLAMIQLEAGDDASAARLCAEGLHQFPDNPAYYSCALEVMAWGDGPARPDSAWKYFREGESRRARGNVSAHAELGVALAAVLARATSVGDSARNVLSRVLKVVADSTAAEDPLRKELLGRSAGVHFRLGDAAEGKRLFDEFVRFDPDNALMLAKRRVLRAYVDPALVPKPR